MATSDFATAAWPVLLVTPAALDTTPGGGGGFAMSSDEVMGPAPVCGCAGGTSGLLGAGDCGL